MILHKYTKCSVRYTSSTAHPEIYGRKCSHGYITYQKNIQVGLCSALSSTLEYVHGCVSYMRDLTVRSTGRSWASTGDNFNYQRILSVKTEYTFLFSRINSARLGKMTTGAVVNGKYARHGKVHNLP